MSQNGAVGIAEAAKLLNMSPAALRKRVHRGTIPSYKGPDGVWYVKVDEVKLDTAHDTRPPRVDTDPTPMNGAKGHPAGQDVSQANVEPLVASLQDEVQFLRDELRQRSRELEDRTEELRRRDIMIMEMTRRIPELPAQIQASPGVESPQPEPEYKPKSWWERVTSWI